MNKNYLKGSMLNFSMQSALGSLLRLSVCAHFGLVFSACDSSTSSKPVERVQKDGSLASVASMTSQKVVVIEVLGADASDTRKGTGFFVSKRGMIATCAHVVAGAQSIKVRTLSGAQFSFNRVVHVDPGRDLALLSVASDSAPCFEESPGKVSVGMKIAVFGNPLGLEGSLTDGIVSAVREMETRGKVLQISAPVSPGSSGSPVVSTDGELVGMVSSRANGGDGIGFAVSADEIWTALKSVEDNSNPSSRVLELSRKRYLASPELERDPEWNGGELPKAPSQRIAALRRLRASHPDVALIRVKLADALHQDGNDNLALVEYASLIREDPGNRMAVNMLIDLPTNDQSKIPIMKVVVAADPLNFRARLFLVDQQDSAGDRLGAKISAKHTLDAAPFSLRTADGYMNALLHYQMYELVSRRGAVDLLNEDEIFSEVSNSIRLMGIIGAVLDVAKSPTVERLDRFVELARSAPAMAFPYAWELDLLRTRGSDALKALLASPSGDHLKAFIDEAIKGEPMIAKAYFGEPGAVEVENGLLFDAMGNAGARVAVPAAFGVDPPFDQLAMVFLLADAEQGGAAGTAADPQLVVRWWRALHEYLDVQRKLGDMEEETSSRMPLIFQFWAATQRKLLEDRLKSEASGVDAERIKDALAATSSVPRRDAAAEAIRALSSKKGVSPWSFYGVEYKRQLERAFEIAATR